MKRLSIPNPLLFQTRFSRCIAYGVSSFGWNLFPAAVKNDQNTIFSPYSIYSCLSMTAAGAQGDTLKEMQKVLHLPD